MSDENVSTQSGQTGDFGGNAGSNPVTGFNQTSANVQSSDPWAEREKQILAKAYQQAQSLVSKSENRQSNQFQGMIDQFKRDYGVTLSPEQAQEIALNQAAKSAQNVQAVAQQQAQQVSAPDPMYQGFMYYHGVKQDSPLFRQVYEVQNTLGVQLEKTDEEYYTLTHPDHKYKPQEFVQAWKQACINKMVRLQNASQGGTQRDDTNLGRMPIIGGQGRKANSYDPARSGKSYLSAYLKDKVK